MEIVTKMINFLGIIIFFDPYFVLIDDEKFNMKKNFFVPVY